MLIRTQKLADFRGDMQPHIFTMRYSGHPLHLQILLAATVWHATGLPTTIIPDSQDNTLVGATRRDRT